MFITRIKRGAVRASLLLQHKLVHNTPRIAKSITRPFRTIILSTLVARTVLLPVTLVAPATAVAAGPDDDPSLRVVRVSVASQEAVQLARTETFSLDVTAPHLSGVTVGQSIADAEAAAEAARIAAEAKAKAAAQARLLADIPAPASADIAAVQDIIRAAASLYGVDAGLMLRIARCESGFSPSAKNAYSSASGLFQFMPSTYLNSPAGREGRSIWDAQANAEAAAYKIANGGLNAWDASRSCWSR